MDISKVIAISGKPGLYKLLNQKNRSFVVEDLTKGRKTSVSAQYNVSLLENIAIYTHTEEVPLGDVFQKIFDKESGEACIDHKASEKELRDYMLEILPDYDADRVYKSDLKKLFQWYNILLPTGLLTAEAEGETKVEAEKKTEQKTAKKESKKAPKKEAATKKADSKKETAKKASKKADKTASDKASKPKK